MRLEGKSAIVTGGASGIGAATVELFVKEGANVVIADMSDHGQALSDKLNSEGYRTIFVKTNVTVETEVQQLIQKTVEAFGKLDIMFANAGIAKDAPAHQLTLDNWNRTIDINLTGVFLCDKYAIEQMMAQGPEALLSIRVPFTVSLVKAVSPHMQPPKAA